MKPALAKHLTLIAVLVAVLLCWLYWPRPLSRVEQQLVGDWVLVSRFDVQRVELRADRRIVFPRSSDEPISLWEVQEGQLKIVHQYKVTAFGLSTPFRKSDPYAWQLNGNPARGFAKLEPSGKFGKFGTLPEAVLIRCDDRQ